MAEAQDAGSGERARRCGTVVEDISMQLKSRCQFLRVSWMNAPA
jgi:hypothetical protein